MDQGPNGRAEEATAGMRSREGGGTSWRRRDNGTTAGYYAWPSVEEDVKEMVRDGSLAECIIAKTGHQPCS